MASVIADRLCCNRSSIKHLLTKSMALPKDIIPERKKGSSRPTTIRSHALKILERYVKKNPCSTACIIKQEVPEVACLTARFISHLILKRL